VKPWDNNCKTEVMPKLRHLLLTAALAIATAGADTVAFAQPGDVLTPQGYGPLRVGMTWAQARRAVPGLRYGESMGDGSTCHEASTPRMPGVFGMFVDGRLVRVSLSSPSRVATARGIRVGASEAQVRTAYRGLYRDEPHQYEGPQGRYLTVWTVRGHSGVRFETDMHHRVQTIHGGTDAIQYVEGCA
jgi:hypothetical protein